MGTKPVAHAGTTASRRRGRHQMLFPSLVFLAIRSEGLGISPQISDRIGIFDNSAHTSFLGFATLPSRSRQRGRSRDSSVIIAQRASPPEKENIGDAEDSFNGNVNAFGVVGSGRRRNDRDGKGDGGARGPRMKGSARSAISNLSAGVTPPRRPPDVGLNHEERRQLRDNFPDDDRTTKSEGVSDGSSDGEESDDGEGRDSWNEYLDPEFYAQTDTFLMPDGSLGVPSSGPGSTRVARRFNGEAYNAAIEGLLSPPGQYGDDPGYDPGYDPYDPNRLENEASSVFDEEQLAKALSESASNRVDPEVQRRQIFKDEEGYLKSSKEFLKALTENSEEGGEFKESPIAKMRREDAEFQAEETIKKMAREFDELRSRAISREDAMKRAGDSQRRFSETLSAKPTAGREEEETEGGTEFCTSCGFALTLDEFRHARVETLRLRRPTQLCRNCHSDQIRVLREADVRFQGGLFNRDGGYDGGGYRPSGGRGGYSRGGGGSRGGRRSFDNSGRSGGAGRLPFRPRNDVGRNDIGRESENERGAFERKGGGPQQRRGIASLSELGGELAKRKKERMTATEPIADEGEGEDVERGGPSMPESPSLATRSGGGDPYRRTMRPGSAMPVERAEGEARITGGDLRMPSKSRNEASGRRRARNFENDGQEQLSVPESPSLATRSGGGDPYRRTMRPGSAMPVEGAEGEERITGGDLRMPSKSGNGEYAKSIQGRQRARSGESEQRRPIPRVNKAVMKTETDLASGKDLPGKQAVNFFDIVDDGDDPISSLGAPDPIDAKKRSSAAGGEKSGEIYARDGSGPWEEVREAKQAYGTLYWNKTTGEMRLPNQMD